MSIFTPSPGCQEEDAVSDQAQAEAIEQIKQLKARYFRGVDLKDFTLLRAVFTDDAVADYRNAAVDPPSGIRLLDGLSEDLILGGETIARWIIDSMQPIVSVHHGHMPEIALTGPDSASGIWAMEDRLYFPVGGALAGIVGFGHYYETYARIGDNWKIKTIRLVRLKVDAMQS